MNAQGATKYDNTMSLIGCTPEWLTEWNHYTESVYCVNDEPTNIDHVIPLSAYDLFNPVDQQNATNWKNLRVIPARMNQSKGGTIPTFPVINVHQQLIFSFMDYMQYSFLKNNGYYRMSY